MTFWKKGQRAAICRKMGIKAHHLHEILYRKRGVNKNRALELANICNNDMGLDIPLTAWLFNKSTSHPAFFGKPIN